MTLSSLADDDDQFADFSFLKNVKPTPVMTMQQIFVQEKGEEHLRTQNINYLHTLRKDEPNMEIIEPRRKRSAPVSALTEEVKSAPEEKATTKPAPVVKVQKSLKLAKSADGKKKEIKVTTTIVKAKPAASKSKSAPKKPVKKTVAKKAASKKIIKVKVKPTKSIKAKKEQKPSASVKKEVASVKSAPTPKKEPELKKREVK